MQVLEVWHVCFDVKAQIAKRIKFAQTCTHSVFTPFTGIHMFMSGFKDFNPSWPCVYLAQEGSRTLQPKSRCLGTNQTQNCHPITMEEKEL